MADVLECVASQQLIPKACGAGRVAAIEVMLANSAIRSHIREAKTYQIASTMQTSRKMGMVTMDEALLNLYQKDIITKERAIAYAQDAPALTKRLWPCRDGIQRFHSSHITPGPGRELIT